jgi:arylsulfatase A-like enzyme
MLWNAETHRPFTWVGMPDSLREASTYERYLMLLERGDALLGELYDGLARMGRLEDTVVIVIGDHGEAHGRGPRPWHWGHGGQVFEDEVHVPFVIIHPSLLPTKVDTPCTHADLFPTLMDVIGREIPGGLYGRSLARPFPGRALFMQTVLWWPLAIRAGDNKLLLVRPGMAPVLFNTALDPEETKNLRRDEPDVTRVLASALLRWNAQRFRTDATFGYREAGTPRLMQGQPRPATP